MREWWNYAEDKDIRMIDKQFLHNDERSLYLAASKVLKAYDWIEYYDILEVEHLRQNPTEFVEKLLQSDSFPSYSAGFFPLLKKIKIEKQTCVGKVNDSDEKVCFGKKEYVTLSGKQNNCEKQKNEDGTQFEYRAWYYIPVEAQIIWTSAAVYLAQVFERYMSHPLEENNNNKIYSYGNRFIKKWAKVDNEWKYEGLNVFSDAIYEPFNRGYSVFKRCIEQRAVHLTQNNRRACYIKSDLSGFYPSVSHKNFKKSIDKLLEWVSLEENTREEIKKICSSLNFAIDRSSVVDQYENLPGIDEHEYLKDAVLPIGLHAAGIFANVFFLAIERELTQYMEDNNIENVYIFRYVDDVTFLSASYTNLQDVYKKYDEICKAYGLTLHRGKEDEGYIDQYNLKPFLTGILNRLSDIGKRVLPALTKKEHNHTIDELINFLETDFADHEIRPDTKDSFIVSKIVNTPFAAAEENAGNTSSGTERLQKISKAIILAIDSHPFKYALYKRYLEFVFRYSVPNYQQTFYLEKFVRLLKEKIFLYADSSEQKFVDFIKLSLLHYITLQLRKNYTDTNIKVAKYLAKSLKHFPDTVSGFEQKMLRRSVLLLELLLREKSFNEAFSEIKLSSDVDAKALLFFLPDALKDQHYFRICKNLIDEKELVNHIYLLRLFMNEYMIANLSLDNLKSLYDQLPKDSRNNHIDLTTSRRNDYLEWLWNNDSVNSQIQVFLQSIAPEETTLYDVIHSHEIWNEYEAAVLAKNILEIDGTRTFSPNCIVITLKNATPSKSTLLKVNGSQQVFSFQPGNGELEEYVSPRGNNPYYGLGVLLYALVTGEYLLPERFRGAKKYNLAVSLERFFSSEAFDDSFRKLVIDLVDLESPIDKSILGQRVKAIIEHLGGNKPFFISANLSSASCQKTFDESIKISVGQLIYNPISYFRYAIGKEKEPDSSKQIDTILSFIDEACKESDILILPELSLPRKYLRSIKRKLDSLEKDLMIISGLSFEKLNATTILNQAIILDRHNEIVFDKLQPSPTIEAKELKAHGMRLKPTNKINIYEHKKFGRFAVLICYDFLSLPIQDLLYKRIDTLFILAFNSDIGGFEFTAEAFVRMSLVNVIIVNCGNYGGSLAISPLRDVHKRVRLIVKGNDINSINTVKIPIDSLHQYKKNRNLNITDFLCENGCVSDDCKVRFIEYPAHFQDE